MHWAALLGHEKVAKHLLKRKANANAKDNKGWTPLHWAAQECDYDMATLLIRYGAKSGKSDNEGNKPSYIANQCKANAALNSKPSYSPTVLKMALSVLLANFLTGCVAREGNEFQ